METAITALIVIGVLILAIFALSERALSAQAVIADSSRALQERAGERARTSLTPLGTELVGDTTVEVTLRNTGETKWADLAQWDVILQYTDALSSYRVKWYPYTQTVGVGNTWTSHIYLVASTGSPEAIEPGIFNPGEEMVIQISISPGVGQNTTNMATIAAPNGISASTIFTH